MFKVSTQDIIKLYACEPHVKKHVKLHGYHVTGLQAIQYKLQALSLCSCISTFLTTCSQDVIIQWLKCRLVNPLVARAESITLLIPLTRYR